MGDKDQLLRMVAVMKANGIDVVKDIVLNHVTGAGSVTGNGGRDPAAMDDGSTNKYKNFRYVCHKSPALNSTEFALATVNINKALTAANIVFIFFIFESLYIS